MAPSHFRFILSNLYVSSFFFFLFFFFFVYQMLPNFSQKKKGKKQPRVLAELKYDILKPQTFRPMTQFQFRSGRIILPGSLFWVGSNPNSSIALSYHRTFTNGKHKVNQISILNYEIATTRCFPQPS